MFIEYQPDLAPVGVSTSRCGHCRISLSYQDQRLLFSGGCVEHECGYDLTDHLADTYTDLSRSSAHLLDDGEVLGATWYHFTTRPEWAITVNPDAMVHIGSEVAAMDRRRTLNYGQKGWMYELALKPGTEVAPGVRLDEPTGWPQYVQDCSSSYIEGANRYLNLVEDPGSISLMVPASALLVRSVQEVASDS